MRSATIVVCSLCWSRLPGFLRDAIAEAYLYARERPLDLDAQRQLRETKTKAIELAGELIRLEREVAA